MIGMRSSNPLQYSQLYRVTYVHQFPSQLMEIYVSFNRSLLTIYKKTSCDPLTMFLWSTANFPKSQSAPFPRESRILQLNQRKCIAFVPITFYCVLSLYIKLQSRSKMASMPANIQPGIIELIVRSSHCVLSQGNTLKKHSSATSYHLQNPAPYSWDLYHVGIYWRWPYKLRSCNSPIREGK